MKTLKTVAPSPAVAAFVNELKAVLAKHETLSAQEMLAGSSQLVGMLIALQDRRLNPEDVLALVKSNIEMGNQTAIEIFLPKGKRD